MIFKISLMIPFIVIALIGAISWSDVKVGEETEFSWFWFIMGVFTYGSACVTICRLIWRVM